MRQGYCFLGLLLLSPLASAQALESAIEQLLSVPAAQRAVWGIHAVDLATGQVLYQRNAGIPLAPASNTKLFSTALGLLRLGPDYRFETRVLAAQAPDAAGLLAGDLVLLGGGDPTLSARAIPYQKGPVKGDPLAPLAELADQLVRAGVRVVEGDLVGDDSRWPSAPHPDGWTVGDVPWEYGAPVSALTLNDNALRLTIRPPKLPGQSAEITLNPPVDHFTVHNTVHVAAGAERKITVDRMPGSRVLLIGGSTPPATGAATELIAVDDPALFAAQALAQLLRDRGVVLHGAPRAAHRAPGRAPSEPSGLVLARRLSPPLFETLRVTNKVSQNLHAEIVLREVGHVRRGEGTSEAAQKEMTELLASLGVDKLDHSLEDGSGLSRRTLVTPAAITTLLRFLHHGELGNVYAETLPIGGEDGTLATRFRGIRNGSMVRAKTGSISHVAALSGFASDSTTRRIAFAIIVNGFTAPTSEIRSLLDKIAVVIQQEGTR
jgi:D-alanyl-D-alanine carboxypeptidase/D-alanyl-D-alanine-endopeptidase (penicillin-binding protein 4)